MLVLRAVVVAPSFSFQELGLSTSSFIVKRGTFIEIHSSSLNNASGVITGITFTSEVETRVVGHSSRPVDRAREP